MRRLSGLCLWLMAGLAPHFSAAAPMSAAADILAGPPTDLSVTVYRAPNRGSGSIDLDRLAGFALISETRTVHIPEGLSRLRFEGVADGIDPSSAIVAGLPSTILEKNREGQLLSPSALISAALGKQVALVRTYPKTGKTERLAGRIESDAQGGVVFAGAQGVEALRCSGLPETFEFTSTELAATPTLSVLVRSSQALTATVTLSYLARGFDWSADYVATLSPDGASLDLGAWVTLANGNGTSFPTAHTQVVAGRLNRVSGEVEPIDIGGPILANCWPRGSTSDLPQPMYLQRAGFDSMAVGAAMPVAMVAGRVQEFAQKVVQEQLGDLKLYRVPDRTTVAARQSKQVRLLDRAAIPVSAVYSAEFDFAANGSDRTMPAERLLRASNDVAHHLGLPLPSGQIAVFSEVDGARLLLQEAGMHDLAVDEEVEIDLGSSADVEVKAVKEHENNRVEVSNARSSDIQFELRLRLAAGARIVRVDHPLASKNGRPIFRFTVPAGTTSSVRYQVAATQHRER
jgi:hypothetical protein